MSVLTASADIRRVLETSRTIAVLGAHHDLTRAAAYVPAYLQRQGYHVVPVNPLLVGRTLHGEAVRATLAEIGAPPGPIDLVDVFRRPVDLPAHLDDILAMDPLPRCVWLQSGIRHAAFARELAARGIEVVEDRCTLQDHKLFGLPRRA